MGFFDNILGSLTGQRKATPYTELSVEDALKQAGPLAASANIGYNQQMVPAMTKLGLESSTMVNPYANELERATTKSILDQLNLGGELPEEIRQQVQRSAMSSGIASGLGVSPAGRSIIARDLGLTGLDLLNQRIGRASAFTPVATSQAARFYNPTEAFAPGAVAGSLQTQQQSRNARDVEEFLRKQSNDIALMNTGGRLLGGVAGGIFGGPMGASLGSSIGGSLFQNPYNIAVAGGGSGGGSNMFTNLLNSKGGGLLESIFGRGLLNKGSGLGGTIGGWTTGGNPLLANLA